MIYFIYHSYSPDTAPTNRALSFIRGAERLNIPITVVYFLPDGKKSKVTDKFKFVKIYYYWEKLYFNHPLFKYISYWLYLFVFIRKLKKGDKVFVGGQDDLLKKVLNKKGIEVYYEKTEGPEVSLSGSHLYTPTLTEHIEMCKSVNGLFVISSALKDYYVSRGISAKKIHIINMTVDADRFKNVFKTEEVEPYIAYCGTVSNNKDGVDDLIRAFSIVSKMYPEIKLYIIGDISNRGETPQNMALIESLGITDSVVFTGRKKATEMPQLLTDAKILALARPDNQQAFYGFPTKLGEYLMTANPVVVTTVGDIPLFLQDNVNALLAPPHNPELFAEKLKWVLEHPEKGQIIGNKGRETAISSFDAINETKKIFDVMLS